MLLNISNSQHMFILIFYNYSGRDEMQYKKFATSGLTLKGCIFFCNIATKLSNF